MDWTESYYNKDATYIHEWTIRDFDKAMKRSDGIIDGPPFKMPGLPWKFFLRISQSECDKDWKEFGYPSARNVGWNHTTGKMLYRDYNDRILRDILNNTGDEVEEDPSMSHLFDVSLQVENPTEDLKTVKLAGSLEVDQGSTGIKSKGHMFAVLDGDPDPSLVGATGSECITATSNRWEFGEEEAIRCTGDRIEYSEGPFEHLCHDFFAICHITPEITLKATIKIASKMLHRTRMIKTADEEKVPFKHLLSEPDFSDVTLRVGQREFSCHRLLLANK